MLKTKIETWRRQIDVTGINGVDSSGQKQCRSLYNEVDEDMEDDEGGRYGF